MTGVIEFLRDGERGDQESVTAGDRTFWTPRKRTVCKDGFEVSIQAGESLYCTPRTNTGPWYAVELGYPSERPEPWDAWSQYAEEPDEPTGTVYGYVPTELVLALIEAHGGER